MTMSFPISLSLSHTHTQTHTDTQLLLILLIFHVNEISFSVPFWDMLRTCVQSILPTAISSFHLFSCVRLCATPWTAAHQDSLSITNSQSCWNSSPSNLWCHPTISSSVIPFSSGFHSFLASGSFPMSQFFASGGQITGVSASASVLLVDNQDWFPTSKEWWVHGHRKA